MFNQLGVPTIYGAGGCQCGVTTCIMDVANVPELCRSSEDRYNDIVCDPYTIKTAECLNPVFCYSLAVAAATGLSVGIVLNKFLKYLKAYDRNIDITIDSNSIIQSTRLRRFNDRAIRFMNYIDDILEHMDDFARLRQFE